MSHIVIHDDDETTQYRVFDDVDAAAVYLEELHDRDGHSSARLYALEEVEFAVKSYVKVEIGSLAPIVPITAPSITETHASLDDDRETTEVTDDVDYTEAPMSAFEAFAPAPMAEHESTGNGEARRGLFGR